MPIYEYQCRNCHHQLEVIQQISEAPLSECPTCNQSTLEKKISAAGFQLKGTGWYVTDFKGGDSKTQFKEAQSEKTSEKVSSETSSEKKTEGPPEGGV